MKEVLFNAKKCNDQFMAFKSGNGGNLANYVGELLERHQYYDYSIEDVLSVFSKFKELKNFQWVENTNQFKNFMNELFERRKTLPENIEDALFEFDLMTLRMLVIRNNLWIKYDNLEIDLKTEYEENLNLIMITLNSLLDKLVYIDEDFLKILNLLNEDELHSKTLIKEKQIKQVILDFISNKKIRINNYENTTNFTWYVNQIKTILRLAKLQKKDFKDNDLYQKYKDLSMLGKGLSIDVLPYEIFVNKTECAFLNLVLFLPTHKVLSDDCYRMSTETKSNFIYSYDEFNKILNSEITEITDYIHYLDCWQFNISTSVREYLLSDYLAPVTMKPENINISNEKEFIETAIDALRNIFSGTSWRHYGHCKTYKQAYLNSLLNVIIKVSNTSFVEDLIIKDKIFTKSFDNGMYSDIKVSAWAYIITMMYDKLSIDCKNYIISVIKNANNLNLKDSVKTQFIDNLNELVEINATHDISYKNQVSSVEKSISYFLIMYKLFHDKEISKDKKRDLFSLTSFPVEYIYGGLMYPNKFKLNQYILDLFYEYFLTLMDFSKDCNKNYVTKSIIIMFLKTLQMNSFNSYKFSKEKIVEISNFMFSTGNYGLFIVSIYSLPVFRKTLGITEQDYVELLIQYKDDKIDSNQNKMFYSESNSVLRDFKISNFIESIFEDIEKKNNLCDILVEKEIMASINKLSVPDECEKIYTDIQAIQTYELKTKLLNTFSTKVVGLGKEQTETMKARNYFFNNTYFLKLIEMTITEKMDKSLALNLIDKML